MPPDFLQEGRSTLHPPFQSLRLQAKIVIPLGSLKIAGIGEAVTNFG
jgi:hypothetical protein